MTDKQIRDRIMGALSVSMMPMEMEAECVAFLDRCLDAPKWIPVTERLPETGESVLVYRGPDTLMNVDYRLGPGLWGADPYYDDEMGVTHWMPLPKPPKEVQP